MTKFYCVKCKKEIEAEEDRITRTKRNVRIAHGNCPACGTKVARILGK